MASLDLSDSVPRFQRTSVQERDRAARYAVMASQRGRIIEGAVEAIAEKGYAGATLTDIVARARVSRSTFYEHFKNKDECILATVELAAAVLNQQMGAAADSAPEDWEAVVTAMLGAYCGILTSEPEFALVAFCEAQAAGPAGRAARDAAIATFVELFRTVHDRMHPVTALNNTQLDVVVAGIADHSRRLLLLGEVDTIDRYVSDYVAAIVSLG